MASLWSDDVKIKKINRAAYGYMYRLDIRIKLACVLGFRPRGKRKFDVDHLRQKVSIEYNRQRLWSRPAIKTMPSDSELAELVRVYERLKGTHYRTTSVYNIWNPILTVYSNSEQELYDIWSSIEYILGNKAAAQTLYKVPDEIKAHVAAGKKVFKKIPTSWTHEVHLKSGFLTEDVTSLLSYLETMPDQVETCRGIQYRKGKRYCYNWWFRTSDVSILEFAKIIAPDSITKVIELVHVS